MAIYLKDQCCTLCYQKSEQMLKFILSKIEFVFCITNLFSVDYIF